MSLIRALLLTLLQTFTEIFPLSNAGHTILLQSFFRFRKSYPAYDVMIDCGTLLAFFIYFSNEIVEMAKESHAVVRWPFSKNRGSFFLDYPYGLTLALLLVSSLVTGIVRFTFQDAGEAIDHWPLALGVMWVIMGIFLFFGHKIENGSRTVYELNHQDAFLIGLAQGFAVFPGISRIGMAVLASLMVGMERKEAARYAVFLGLPYIVCAVIYKLSLGLHFYDADQRALLLSFVAAIALALLFLVLVMRILQKGKFFLFGFYCVAIGFFTIFYALLKGQV